MMSPAIHDVRVILLSRRPIEGNRPRDYHEKIFISRRISAVKITTRVRIIDA